MSRRAHELVALCAMYVDDIWCIGLPSAVTAILDFVSGTWETKLGGFISRDPSITISVNGEVLPRLDEITFIGQQFRFKGDEVVINQRCWLLNELAKRNWLHLKGSPSLLNKDQMKIVTQVNTNGTCRKLRLK